MRGGTTDRKGVYKVSTNFLVGLKMVNGTINEIPIPKFSVNTFSAVSKDIALGLLLFNKEKNSKCFNLDDTRLKREINKAKSNWRNKHKDSRNDLSICKVNATEFEKVVLPPEILNNNDTHYFDTLKLFSKEYSRVLFKEIKKDIFDSEQEAINSYNDITIVVEGFAMAYLPQMLLQAMHDYNYKFPDRVIYGKPHFQFKHLGQTPDLPFGNHNNIAALFKNFDHFKQFSFCDVEQRRAFFDTIVELEKDLAIALEINEDFNVLKQGLANYGEGESSIFFQQLDRCISHSGIPNEKSIDGFSTDEEIETAENEISIREKNGISDSIRRIQEGNATVYDCQTVLANAYIDPTKVHMAFSVSTTYKMDETLRLLKSFNAMLHTFTNTELEVNEPFHGAEKVNPGTIFQLNIIEGYSVMASEEIKTIAADINTKFPGAVHYLTKVNNSILPVIIAANDIVINTEYFETERDYALNTDDSYKLFISDVKNLLNQFNHSTLLEQFFQQNNVDPIFFDAIKNWNDKRLQLINMAHGRDELMPQRVSDFSALVNPLNKDNQRAMAPYQEYPNAALGNNRSQTRRASI